MGLFLQSLAVLLELLNIFIELNESPPGSIHTAAFAASASFMEREGNIKYEREIIHKPTEASTLWAGCELRKRAAGESAGSFS